MRGHRSYPNPFSGFTVVGFLCGLALIAFLIWAGKKGGDLMAEECRERGGQVMRRGWETPACIEPPGGARP